MPKFILDPVSLTVDYECERSDEIEASAAQAMALIDIAKALSTIENHAERVRDDVESIAKSIHNLSER